MLYFKGVPNIIPVKVMYMLCKCESKSLSQGSCWKINTKLIPTQAQESPEPIYDLVDCGLKSLPPGVFSKCKVLRKEALLLQVFICIQFNLDN